MNTATTTRFIALDKARDGARVLYRHFLTQRPPAEGWVREFSTDGAYVRISPTQRPGDAGTWHRVYDLRCEGVLEQGRALDSARAATFQARDELGTGGES